jgi:hypothetical protein
MNEVIKERSKKDLDSIVWGLIVLLTIIALFTLIFPPVSAYDYSFNVTDSNSSITYSTLSASGSGSATANDFQLMFQDITQYANAPEILYLRTNKYCTDELTDQNNYTAGSVGVQAYINLSTGAHTELGECHLHYNIEKWSNTTTKDIIVFLDDCSYWNNAPFTTEVCFQC